MKIISRELLKTQTKTCHASTICFYRDKLITSWFGGSKEGAPDCAIYIQYDDKIAVIGGKDGIPRWNPVLFNYEDKLFLFIKIGNWVDRWNSFIYNISDIFEDNFDINNVKPQILPAGLNGPTKTKPIIKNGVIYCGSSVETLWDWNSVIEAYIYDKSSESLVFANRSHPLTVEKQVYNDEYYGVKRLSLGIIQPSIWMDKNGNLQSLVRSSRGLGRIYYSFSQDEINELWYPPKPTHFENPNSGIDTLYCDDRLFLVYNPSSKSRYPLVIHELENDMFTVVDELVIAREEDLEEDGYSREFSYPYIIQYGGYMHLVYTRQRKNIEYCKISMD